jgi:23S rRNA (pseudouridine1915-N3)-methyltransferase
MFTILNISDSDKHFSSAIQEYIKRLGKDVQIIDLKPIKKSSPAECIQADTDTIFSRIEKKGKSDVIIALLSKSGKQLTTEQLCTQFPLGSNVFFVIGGPYGLDEERMKHKCHLSISLGAITLPHGLCKLTLLEQLYRIHTIQTGKSYHY